MSFKSPIFFKSLGEYRMHTQQWSRIPQSDGRGALQNCTEGLRLDTWLMGFKDCHSDPMMPPSLLSQLTYLSISILGGGGGGGANNESQLRIVLQWSQSFLHRESENLNWLLICHFESQFHNIYRNLWRYLSPQCLLEVYTIWNFLRYQLGQTHRLSGIHSPPGKLFQWWIIN